METTWIGAAAAAAIALGAAGYAVAQDSQPSSSQQMQQNRDAPPGDAFIPDKRGERAQTAAPQKSKGEVGPSMGENQKPNGKVGP